jgi:archaellum component FlaG (FlaF/FlaG flagellin family)
VRGFSVAMSHIIFFIATLIAVAIAVAAISVALKGLSYAMTTKTQLSTNQISTYIKIVDGGADQNTNHLWVYVKNLGETTLDVNKMDIFVNNKYISSCNEDNVICTDESGDYKLSPDELLDVNITTPLSSGSYDVKVVTQYGVYAAYEVVVG